MRYGHITHGLLVCQLEYELCINYQVTTIKTIEGRGIDLPVSGFRLPVRTTFL